jgi:hypothetical protein
MDMASISAATLTRLRAHAKAQKDPQQKQVWYRAIDEFDSGFDTRELVYLIQVKEYPVSFEEFMFGDKFLARPKDEIYPAVLEELIKINNPGEKRLSNPYTEIVLTGGIGSAKTTTALYTLAYQLYVLSMFPSPHSTFGMDSTSEILFVFQSLSGILAKSVDYARFKAIMDQSVYFHREFPYRTDLESELRFPNRIIVKPISSDIGAIGQNVIGGLIDEVNFMSLVEKSVKNVDRGTYDQALQIYNGIARRRKSRFLQQGSMPGVLCLVSSKKYPGEFTDMKIAEAQKDPTIYIYDKCVWQIKPPNTFSGKWFKVFVGDMSRKPRILEDGDPLLVEDKLVKDIPIEYRKEFTNDIIGSLRDIAGVSTMARHPFILDVDRASKCFGTHKSIFSLEETDFQSSILHLFPGRTKEHQYPRWAHVDLGLTNDSCGLAIGYCPGFKAQEFEGNEELMPIVHIDGLLRITPPPNGEILFHKVREILYQLRNKGIPIRWVSFDTYQSVDSVQTLKQRGFMAGNVTLDKTTAPYEFLKMALYDQRVFAPTHEKCVEELLSLERDLKRGKIDHPPNGSKDVADALAGVVYGITMRRETWHQHRVQISVALTNYIRKIEQAKRTVA